MRTFALLAAAASALLLSAPAAAKELVKAELCGAAGCTAVDKSDLRLLPLGGDTYADPPPLGPFHELVTTVQDGPESTDTNTWTTWYVPSAGVIAFTNEYGSTTFHPLYGLSATFMKQLAKSVQPFPTPRITAAFVNGKRVTGDPGTYARLFAVERAGPVRATEGDRVPIEVVSARRSPWTNGGVSLSYWPDSGVLLRGPEQVRIADGLVDDLGHARALGTDRSGTALLPWLALAGLVAAIVLLAALGAWFRRRPDAVSAAAKPTIA
jgi:hypothetical protein